jgi:hypothetical protein
MAHFPVDSALTKPGFADEKIAQTQVFKVREGYQPRPENGVRDGLSDGTNRI